MRWPLLNQERDVMELFNDPTVKAALRRADNIAAAIATGDDFESAMAAQGATALSLAEDVLFWRQMWGLLIKAQLERLEAQMAEQAQPGFRPKKRKKVNVRARPS